MPTYPYECGSCGHAFEEFQSIKAESLVVCPVCSMPDLRRTPQAGLPIGIFEAVALESYGAPNDQTRRQQEKKYGFEFDSRNRLVVRSPKELQRVKKIFGDA